ncbi:MAG: hypothetical protein GXP49_12875 [Deltaproteobacteria bacterium]|nr:hypothetical protein [Deltaproteobacteria bacterium]
MKNFVIDKYTAIFLLLFLSACTAGDSSFVPFNAPLFDAYDLNPDSATHDQVRHLSEQKGKITVLYFTSYGCSYCITHFPYFYAILEGLGDNVFTSQVELWLIGYPVAGSKAVDFCKGTVASCFLDKGYGEGSLYNTYGANLGDLFLIDRKLVATKHFNLVTCPMERKECEHNFEGAINRVLADSEK